MSTFAAITLSAQQTPVELFPGGAPGETITMTENGSSEGNKVGGETVYRLTNVTSPTITVFQAQDAAQPTAAVVVCPGGGYNILAYDHEGEEVCRWLNNIGITGVLLKYRVPRREGKEKHAAPLQDVQRALGYVRHNADKYGIDPNRIGVMGFSAGGHLAATLSNNYSGRSYPAVDAADAESCRPNFCLLVYPAYLGGSNFEVAPELKVTAETPPTMIIQTEDDKPHIRGTLPYYYALMEAGVPAWAHFYAKGGHGYGLRDTGATVNEWPYRVEDWFREIDIIR